jgi:hypothetical protein
VGGLYSRAVQSGRSCLLLQTMGWHAKISQWPKARRPYL